MHPRPIIRPSLVAAVMAAAAVSSPAAAQEGPVDAFYRGVADHFGLPLEEVRVLAEWDLPPEEAPVVQFLASHGGVSSDALIALQTGGRSWVELAQRYDVGAGAFHVPLEGPAGPLAGAYEKYRATPSSGWDGIVLQEAELVGLVNLKFISEYLRVSPRQVVDARRRHGSWVAAYAALVGAGG